MLAKVKELVSHHHVHQVELCHAQHQTDHLGEHQLEGAGVEPARVVDQELAQSTNLVLDRSLRQWIFADFLHQFADSASFHSLPVDPGGVADGGLYDHQKTDPLVVVVVDNIGALHPVPARLEARVCRGTLVDVKLVMGVGRPHEAVGLKHRERNGWSRPRHAVDGFAEELLGGCED